MWQCVKKGPRVFRGNVKCIDEGRELVVAIYSENLESVQKICRQGPRVCRFNVYIKTESL